MDMRKHEGCWCLSVPCSLWPNVRQPCLSRLCFNFRTLCVLGCNGVYIADPYTSPAPAYSGPKGKRSIKRGEAGRQNSFSTLCSLSYNSSLKMENIFLRNVGLSPVYTALQTTRSWCPESQCRESQGQNLIVLNKWYIANIFRKTAILCCGCEPVSPWRDIPCFASGYIGTSRHMCTWVGKVGVGNKEQMLANIPL
jgi:hypothetical protein